MTHNELYNEQELVSAVARGNEAAFKRLFQFYWPRIYSVALVFVKSPELAEDAAQEVFAQLWIKRDLLNNVQAFRPYLYTAARNLLYNRLRSQVFTDGFQDYLQEYFADNLADPAVRLELKEAAELIEAGINQLTPQQQKVFRLSRFQGLSHAEIAAATGLSPRTIKNYMVSANLALRQYLEQYASSLFIACWIEFFL
ncbi:MAG: RNA polymerase sigma-70 factor [Candidatus Pseudobacter hemicellulosilyticus]|uniref:RNA polymerase sigma-70 factor n=1 Tax=Candidatus Pseudobacter hemicellulosilyticus TaxID=3121375 RepID=A0AAJ5WVA2_9BACT|nr:MAG: RNA polymerase sigma-70 factor [Pseudobacter sp.]